MAAGKLEAVVGAEEVRVHDELGAAVDPRHHRRLGGALDDRVDRASPLKVGRRAHVAVHEPNAGLTKARQVQLAAAALEVVEGDHVALEVAPRQRDAEVGAHEARAAGHEDSAAHGARTLDDAAALQVKCLLSAVGHEPRDGEGRGRRRRRRVAHVEGTLGL